MRMQRYRTLVLLLGAATLSACSPYVYDREIAGFSAGVDAVVASYQGGRQAVDTAIVERQLAADATARTRLLLLPGCDQTDPSGTPPRLPDCAVVPFDAKAAPAPTAVQLDLADAAPAFNALKVYAAALTAVTSASDEAALNQATRSLTGAVAAAVGTAATLQPKAAPVAALVEPVGGLLGQGIALWLDQRRLAALRRMVPVMDPEAQVLGQTVWAALADIRAQRSLQLGAEVRGAAEPLEGQAVSKLSPPDYQSKRTALEARIAAFNQARAADPAATVATLVDAHHQLAQALLANVGQGAAVLARVQAFVIAAETLKTAIGAPAIATAKATAPAAPTTPASRK
jgi:hypothetical protein